MNHVLTLVHGTWPDPDGWVSARSFLRRELAARLGNVTFREFTWSGANRHVARREGGDDLARFIREGREQHADARHFVVAHSHGGNVALYATRDPAARARPLREQLSIDVRSYTGLLRTAEVLGGREKRRRAQGYRG